MEVELNKVYILVRESILALMVSEESDEDFISRVFLVYPRKVSDRVVSTVMFHCGGKKFKKHDFDEDEFLEHCQIAKPKVLQEINTYAKLNNWGICVNENIFGFVDEM